VFYKPGFFPKWQSSHSITAFFPIDGCDQSFGKVVLLLPVGFSKRHVSVFIDTSLLIRQNLLSFDPVRPFLMAQLKATTGPEPCKSTGIPLTYYKSIAVYVQLFLLVQLGEGHMLVLMEAIQQKVMVSGKALIWPPTCCSRL
jgi:hypothetical protein